MSDKFYSEPNEASAMRSWVMWQMLRGAGWAAVFVLVLAVTYGVIWGIGQLLPDASKEAPSPYGALELSSPLSATA